MSALGFKARMDPLHAFSLVRSSDSPLVQHLLTVEVSMAAKPFRSTYLQTVIKLKPSSSNRTGFISREI